MWVEKGRGSGMEDVLSVAWDRLCEDVSVIGEGQDGIQIVHRICRLVLFPGLSIYRWRVFWQIVFSMCTESSCVD